MEDLRSKELVRVLLWSPAPRPSPRPGLQALAVAWSRAEAAPETQNEVFVWNRPPGFTGPFPCHTIPGSAGWQALGQLVEDIMSPLV